MPGAGSIVATNYVYNVAPQDGSVIGAVQRPIPFEPFFDEKGVRFDVRKINWLGSTTSEVGVVVRGTRRRNAHSTTFWRAR